MWGCAASVDATLVKSMQGMNMLNATCEGHATWRPYKQANSMRENNMQVLLA